ncbi:alpha-glucosidase C-terminal domain-containing protein, partial [Salinactinospora qingdaonensis]|uniref:alpha-glucosidase C-terminal domain-containing protein n=1 Tax=Salinactinospora qingdaonensis TaxID=702744 RepID=UPI0031E5226D
YLPLVMDPIYGYQALNVEAQRDNPGSLLNWMRKMIQIRKRHPAFGTGDFRELEASNPSVLAYVRRHTDVTGARDTVVCVHNFSRFPQPVDVRIPARPEDALIELTGGVPFPSVEQEQQPYRLTLPGHGFYWIAVHPEEGRS